MAPGVDPSEQLEASLCVASTWREAPTAEPDMSEAPQHRVWMRKLCVGDARSVLARAAMLRSAPHNTDCVSPEWRAEADPATPISVPAAWGVGTVKSQLNPRGEGVAGSRPHLCSERRPRAAPHRKEYDIFRFNA